MRQGQRPSEGSLDQALIDPMMENDTTTGHGSDMKPVVIGMGDFQAEAIVVSIGFSRFNFESVRECV